MDKITNNFFHSQTKSFSQSGQVPETTLHPLILHKSDNPPQTSPILVKQTEKVYKC